MKKATHLFIFRLIFISCISLFSTHIHAQKLDSTLAVYADKYQQERMYLHYDKSSYYAGETIWFKAYLMAGILPSPDSKTLYVDWVDDNGKVLSHTVSPVVDATSNGQFDIPASYTGNMVHVRAYTRWMLNFDSSFLYSKDIRILAKNPTATSSKITIIPSLQFFPEGGDMVAGINNKIAFKAADQWGRPVQVKGMIVSGTSVVDSLHAQHDGMGYFFLIPKPGVAYTAKWKDAKGAEHTTALPNIKASGLSMQIGISGTKRIFTINRTNDVGDNLKTVHLVGTMHQHMVFKTTVDLTTAATKSEVIPTAELPTGILTITLFDNNWNAIAERITYVNNHEYAFPTTMEVQHWGLSKRAKDEIQITVPDSMEANLSIAVTDAGIESDSSDNIISHLLLTGDIKGHVYNPWYYFSGNSDIINRNLDLVMLTHGWRRFKWEDVAKGKLPVITFPKDTAYLTLSGKVYGITPSEMREAGNLIVIIKQKDSSNKMLVESLHTDGTFNDPNVIFFDTLNVYYQFQKMKALSGAEVHFMNNRLPAFNYTTAGKNFLLFSPVFDTTGAYRHYLLAQENLQLQELLKGKTLETVTVKAKTKSPVEVLDQKYTSGLFQGGDGYQFDLVNDASASSYPSIFTYLQGRVAGLLINTTGASTTLQWRGSTPQLFLDEVPTDASMLSSVNMADVAYVKVLRPPFMGATGGGAGGAIAIYTRRGGDVQKAAGKGLASNTITAYTPIKEFYSPNYSTFDPRNEQRDVRTTLYWNPRIITSPGKHTVTLSFYNNDVSESFRVIIEGMTKDGQLTHLEQIME